MGPDEVSVVRLEVLGPLRAFRRAAAAEVEIPLGGPKPRAVLALLALAAGRPVSRDALVEFIWSEAPPPSAVAALQNYVAALRQALEPDRSSPVKHRLIRSSSGGYLLDTAAVEVDLERFRQLVNAARMADRSDQAAGLLRAAIGLRRGRTLDDLGGLQGMQPAVTAVEQEYLGAALDCADAQLRAGQQGDLQTWLPPLAGTEPLNEPLQARVVRLYQALGQRANALTTYERTRRGLRAELGVSPGPELREAHLAVLREDEPELEPGPEPLRRSWIGRGPEPQPLIGRDQLLADLARSTADHRVVTLVGPGGAGKTALALAAAELVAPDHAYGVVVIECGRLPAETAAPDGPNLVAEALRSALDAPIGRESPLAATAQILQGQQRLIVFDNAEHVRRSCARLVDHLSRSCPRVRHLVTSRHQLGLPAETVWEVEPLPVPAAETWQSDQIAASPAVQLFTRLARQIRPRLDVASQLTAVAGICRDLGGLPLAIELATARLRAMSISDLADRLTANQAVLTATADHRLPHQHTLQSTFEWSEQLLPPAERLLLARLAVFPATFDLAAAEQVCGHDPLPVADIAPLVTSLVDHSMMQTVDSGTELHYRLLPPIREFATHRADPAESQAARRGHLRWCGALLQAVEDAPRDEPAAVAAAAAHLDDIHTALVWALDSDDPALWAASAEMLAAGRPVFEQPRVNLDIVRRLTQRALARGDDLPVPLRAHLSHWAGRLAYLHGRPREVSTHLTTALTLIDEDDPAEAGRRVDIGIGLVASSEMLADPAAVEQAGGLVRAAEATADPVTLVITLTDMANISGEWGHYGKAGELLGRATAIADLIEENAAIRYRIGYRGASVALWSGHPDEALRQAEALLAARAPLRLNWLIETLAYCGWAYARLGQFERGRQRLTESLELSGANHRTKLRGVGLLAYADLERLDHHPHTARRHLRDCLTACLSVSDLRTTTRAVWLAALLCEPPEADRLRELSVRARELTKLPSWPLDDKTFVAWSEKFSSKKCDEQVGEDRQSLLVAAAETALVCLRSGLAPASFLRPA
ncbi:BTAD domain-containing putative transcriptional regulator [Fodinicola feengrottensis]|uniref:BTAD domain-containing putative transcriptional regulator n=1 Tax=Fodinicola feengrottensis TaxID=435914 RepID=UPI0031D4CFB4